MRKANITDAKNNFSKLLAEIRGGETVVIFDRDVPVARLEAVGYFGSASSRIPALVREGVVSAPEHPLDVKRFLARTKVKLKSGTSSVRALLEERAEGK